MMGLFAGCLMVVMSSCKKSGKPGSGAEQLSAQEQMLLGKWTLTCSETYEVSGADSAGNLVLNLVDVNSYSPGCRIEFRGDAFDAGKQYHRAAGTFAGCDSAATFPWKIKQPAKLDIRSGPQYDINLLCHDSAVFSAVYVKDILKLKSVYHYRRS